MSGYYSDLYSSSCFSLFLTPLCLMQKKKTLAKLEDDRVNTYNWSTNCIKKLPSFTSLAIFFATDHYFDLLNNHSQPILDQGILFKVLVCLLIFVSLNKHNQIAHKEPLLISICCQCC